jgi:SAM-dependent methyltransferase
MLELRPTDVLLDLGCGTGAAVREAAATARRAVGIDLSPAMITRARDLAAGIGNAEFLAGDVSGPLAFADGEFTAILCTTAFHHFPRQRDTIAETARVLAPRGRLMIADANRSHPVVFVLDQLPRIFQRSHVGFASPAQLASDLAAAGFATVFYQHDLGRRIRIRQSRAAGLNDHAAWGSAAATLRRWPHAETSDEDEPEPLGEWRSNT